MLCNIISESFLVCDAHSDGKNRDGTNGADPILGFHQSLTSNILYNEATRLCGKIYCIRISQAHEASRPADLTSDSCGQDHGRMRSVMREGFLLDVEERLGYPPPDPASPCHLT
jgi:hypothetical protein